MRASAGSDSSERYSWSPARNTMCLPAPGPVVPSYTTRCGFCATAVAGNPRHPARTVIRIASRRIMASIYPRTARTSPELSGRVPKGTLLPILKAEADRALHDARRPGLGRLAKARVDHLPLRVGLRVGIDLGPVHLVQQVVDLPAQLDPPRTAHREVLEHRHVGVDDPRHLEERARRVADVAAPGEPAERRRVEEAAGPARSRIAVAARAEDLAVDPGSRAAVPARKI